MGITRDDIEKALSQDNKADDFQMVVYQYLDACDKAELKAMEFFGYFFWDMLPACPRSDVWEWLVELDKKSEDCRKLSEP